MRTFLAALWMSLIALPAAAATVTTISMSLNWERTLLHDVYVQDTSGGTYLGTITQAEDIWGLPHALSGTDLSAPLNFSAQFVRNPAGVWNDYTIRTCDFGGTNCNGWFNDYWSTAALSDTAFHILTGDQSGFSVRGGLGVGDTVDFNDWINGGRVAYAADGAWDATYGDVSSRFTVLGSDVSVVVQPLPASLLMLPAGLGALVLLRRRRKPA